MRSLGRDSTRSYLGRSVCVPVSKACLKDRAIRVTRFALTEVSRGRSRNLPNPMATRRTKRLVVENNQGRTIHVLEPSKTHASQTRTPTGNRDTESPVLFGVSARSIGFGGQCDNNCWKELSFQNQATGFGLSVPYTEQSSRFKLRFAAVIATAWIWTYQNSLIKFNMTCCS